MKGTEEYVSKRCSSTYDRVGHAIQYCKVYDGSSARCNDTEIDVECESVANSVGVTGDRFKSLPHTGRELWVW